MHPTKEQHHIFGKSGGKNSATETLAMIRKESIISKTEKTEREMKSKVKSMLIIFFVISLDSSREFVLAGQTVNSAYCWDVSRRLREHVRELLPELWRQRTGC
jgi:hypothetical protein